jgi:hypothetical protein
MSERSRSIDFPDQAAEASCSPTPFTISSGDRLLDVDFSLRRGSRATVRYQLSAVALTERSGD